MTCCAVTSQILPIWVLKYRGVGGGGAEGGAGCAVGAEAGAGWADSPEGGADCAICDGAEEEFLLGLLLLLEQPANAATTIATPVTLTMNRRITSFSVALVCFTFGW